jgi:hypothetical protein
MARFYLALGVEVGRHRKCSKDYHHYQPNHRRPSRRTISESGVYSR